jgi:HD-GYP domain-containing protein (c-di-GMP phosphodiesterase class II)
MRLVATTRFREGAKLGTDIPAGAGEAPLLKAGVVLSERHRQVLLERGVNAVYVDDALGQGIEVLRGVSERTREEARTALTEAVADIGRSGALDEERIADLRDVAAAIAAEVAAVGEAALALTDLAAADSYTMEHSIDVTVVGLLVARHLWRTRGRLDYQGKRSWHGIDQHLTQLGVGLFLHDIGKLAVPRGVVHKEGPLEPEERELLRRHPLFGLEMLRGDGIGPRAKDVVRSHHERWDGGGYPRGIAGPDISQFARIAAVANVFDAVTSERPGAAAAPQHGGVEAIRAGAGSEFDPEVVAAFCEVVAPYPAGSDIELSDGRRGIVVSVSLERIDLPRVRVYADAAGRELKPVEVDLTSWPELAPRASAVA